LKGDCSTGREEGVGMEATAASAYRARTRRRRRTPPGRQGILAILVLVPVGGGGVGELSEGRGRLMMKHALVGRIHVTAVVS